MTSNIGRNITAEYRLGFLLAPGLLGLLIPHSSHQLVLAEEQIPLEAVALPGSWERELGTPGSGLVLLGQVELETASLTIDACGNALHKVGPTPFAEEPGSSQAILITSVDSEASTTSRYP